MTNLGPGPRTPGEDRKLIRRVIARAIAEQGPAAREQYAAAVDVMRALGRAGFEIVRRGEADRRRSLRKEMSPW